MPKSTKKLEQDKYIGSVKHKSEETKTKGRAVITHKETKTKPVTSSGQVRGVTSSASSTISILTLNDYGEDDLDEVDEQDEVCLLQGPVLSNLLT